MSQLLGLPAWMEPLVLDYCTRSDKKYWQHPYTCNPQDLSFDQVNALKDSRRDFKFGMRACEWDIVTECIWTKEKSEQIIRICSSRPFKPNIMNHVLETILNQPSTNWRQLHVLSWFNNDNICDFNAYKWFQSKDLIPPRFSIHKHAMIIDDVELYQLYVKKLEDAIKVPLMIYSHESIRNFIKNRCFRILEWVLTQPHVDVSDLFSELLQYRPSLRIVQAFPKQKVRFPETDELSFECVQYLMDEGLLDCSVAYLCEFYSGHPHDLTALQFMAANHQTWHYEWSLATTDLKYMKLIYQVNPILFQCQITSLFRYRETKFWLRHGGICDLEDLLKQYIHSPLSEKKLFKLFDSHPTQIQSGFGFSMPTSFYKGTKVAPWIVHNIAKNRSQSHFLRACQLCSPSSLKILFDAFPGTWETQLLCNVSDESMMVVWIQYFGLERIIDYISNCEHYHLYPVIARAILITQPSWELVQRLLAKDIDLVFHLKLYLLWPDAFVSSTREHFIVQRLFQITQKKNFCSKKKFSRIRMETMSDWIYCTPNDLQYMEKSKTWEPSKRRDSHM